MEENFGNRAVSSIVQSNNNRKHLVFLEIFLKTLIGDRHTNQVCYSIVMLIIPPRLNLLELNQSQ